MSFWIGFIIGIAFTIFILVFSLRKMNFVIAHKSALIKNSRKVKRFNEL